jgi:hypothetical protein
MYETSKSKGQKLVAQKKVREFMSVMINVSVSHRKKGKRVMLLASRSYRYVKGEVGYSRDG